jgi:hypothetical protein
MPKATFSEVLRAAVADLAEHGYDDRARVDAWLLKLREAAEASLIPETQLRARLAKGFGSKFHRYLSSNQLLKRHRNLDRFTIKQVAPQLRRELDKRIMASARLIVLNRDSAIQKTLQRFEGWATAIPKGGSRNVDRKEANAGIGKAIRGIPFEERRVAVDQGHKLIASVDETLAVAGDAIAAVFRSHWREIGYDYRLRHKQFDGRIFVVRDNWAMGDGLMKLGGRVYTDQIERPAELPFCRCYYTYLYSLADLPTDMLTAKGKMALQQRRKA